MQCVSAVISQRHKDYSSLQTHTVHHWLYSLWFCSLEYKSHHQCFVLIFESNNYVLIQNLGRYHTVLASGKRLKYFVPRYCNSLYALKGLNTCLILLYMSVPQMIVLRASQCLNSISLTNSICNRKANIILSINNYHSMN